ncbi:MAG TPA: cadherin repeat domain-containing protein, partial [Gammaproteobacteria bacterium]|nr:cadherin repeat domain-containing protein [Gammaproteobacteria bacterium]
MIKFPHPFSILGAAALSGALLFPLAAPAALDAHAVLNINKGEGGFTRPADGSGSWFAMESLGEGKWLYVGIEGRDGVKLGEVQAASTADPDALVKGIDEPWIFFSNQGLHQTTSAPGIISDDGAGNVVLDFSGWGVDWNGIETIPMPSGANPGVDGDLANADGQALLKCANDCGDGDSYVLNYTAIVPDDSGTNFSGVKYHLHLEGTISAPTDAGGGNPEGPRVIDPNAPVVRDVQAALAAGGRATIDFSGAVSDPQGAGSIDFASMRFVDHCVGGAIIYVDANGQAIYADGAGLDEDCTLDYTVRDNTGLESDSATVFVRIRQGNIPPIAHDDAVVVDPGQSAVIDVVANDVDGDDGLQPDSVKILDNPAQGRVSVAADGKISYQPNGANAGIDAFTYVIQDTRGEISNPATVAVRVNQPPVVADDAATVARGASVVIEALANDVDDDGFRPASVTIAQAGNGKVEINPETGALTYTAQGDFLGEDRFQYTVEDSDGVRSDPATVVITVVNAIPVASDFSATLNIASDDKAEIDLLAHAEDGDGDLSGARVEIVEQPANGAVTVGDGGRSATYAPSAGFIGQDSFSYVVIDGDGGRSEAATVSVTVADASAAVLDPEAILTINAGKSSTEKPAPGAGSWFAMEAAGPGGWIYVGLSANEGVQLGQAQPASSSPLKPSIDNPWVFFGNLGVHQTTQPPTIISDDGAGHVSLDFSGWGVSWNGIPVIPLDKRPNGGVEGGASVNPESVALMTCQDADPTDGESADDCSLGDSYTLSYTATVPAGDPSGFGNVSYVLHLEGNVVKERPQLGHKDPNAPADVTTVAVLGANGERGVLGEDGSVGDLNVTPGLTAQDLGLPTGYGLTAEQLGLPDPSINPASGIQCLGGCIDILAPVSVVGEAIEVVFKLSEPLKSSTDFRIHTDNGWQDFDQSTGDAIGSAPANDQGQCTDPRGAFDPGL